MVEKTVMLSSFGKLKDFVATVSSLDYDVTAASGNKTANAKNITELFAFDLTKPVTVIADTKSVAIFSNKIKLFSVD